jgi:hypothetical protein
MGNQVPKVGDIWRFEAPHWSRCKPVSHYLILEISDEQRKYYLAQYLEEDTLVYGLIIDESNVRNYNAHKVA